MKITDKKLIRRVQILDIAMMCLLYIIQACIFGYVMSYLTDKGLTTGQIGFLSAGFGALAAFLQPVLGRISDRSRYFDWKKQLFIISISIEVIAVLILIFQAKIPSAILFGLFLVGVNCMNPFVFASPFYYERFGISINFGRVRALGSASYALMSFVMGQLISRFGLHTVPVAILISTILFTATVWFLPRFEDKPLNYQDYREDPNPKEALNNGDRIPFYKKYPSFIRMVAAVFLIMYVFNVTSGFLFQIVTHAGGDNASLGLAGAVGAICEVPMIFFFTTLAKKFSVSRMILIGAVGFVIRMVVYLFASNVPMAIFGTALSAISYAIIAPAVVYYADNETNKEDAVTAQSYMTMAQVASGIAANLITGFIYDSFGYTAMILSALAVSVLAVFMTLTAMKKKQARA